MNTEKTIAPAQPPTLPKAFSTLQLLARIPWSGIPSAARTTSERLARIPWRGSAT